MLIISNSVSLADMYSTEHQYFFGSKNLSHSRLFPNPLSTANSAIQRFGNISTRALPVDHCRNIPEKPSGGPEVANDSGSSNNGGFNIEEWISEMMVNHYLKNLVTGGK